ncbi:MAG: hypothetical protein ACRDP6_32340 [Actinoallomurus sp.]
MDKSREANTQLQYWFDRAGFTRQDLAHRVGKRAETRGEPQVRPDESRVRRWLDPGEIPRPPVPEILAELFSERLGIPLTPADLGLPGPDQPLLRTGIDLPWHCSSTTTAMIDQLSRSDLMLPRMSPDDAAEIQQGKALLTPLQHWPYAEPSILTPSAEPFNGRIGHSEVSQIRQVTAMFRETDNRIGGGLSRKAVVAQMQQVNALITSCTYTEQVGRELFRAVADLGSVAGWMSFDANMHGSAQRLFVLALHAASEGGDKALGAHILQCMARQMSHLGQIKDALDLLALAQYGSRHEAAPATKAALAALESRFRAIDGHLAESDAAAGAALDAYERDNPTDDIPDWMRWFDRAELCATLGVAHQIAARQSTGPERFRRAERSTALINEALSLRPPDRVRSSAFDRIGLARTHIVAGELEGACQETRTAITMYDDLSSVRMADRIAELDAELAPHADESSIRDLREEITAALTATP